MSGPVFGRGGRADHRQRPHQRHLPKMRADRVKGVKALFVQWNEALGDPTANKVVALCANDATLLPTVENGPYILENEPFTKANGLKEYFVHFVERKPVATIDEAKRFIKVGCNIAYDIGLYSFEVNGEHATNRETIRARYTFIYSCPSSKVWPRKA
jgi:hypothetical protein